MDRPNEIKAGRCASAANTGTAKQVASGEKTMSANIVANFDRDVFMSQVDRLDPITQEAFMTFLNRLSAMTDNEVLDLTHKLGGIKWQQPDEMRLIGLLLSLPDEGQVEDEDNEAVELTEDMS